MKKHIELTSVIVSEVIICLIMIFTGQIKPWIFLILVLILLHIFITLHYYRKFVQDKTLFRHAIDIKDDDKVSGLLAEITSNKFYDSDMDDTISEYVNWCIHRNNAEIFNKQTELAALQSQINPHFLYNTLDSIRSEALINGDKEVAYMIETLASFFRYSISRKGNLVPLRDELENTNNYMIIQKYRFNNRFSLEIQIDDEDQQAMDCYVPRLLIQPIVENAIYHGFEDMTEGGVVTIDVAMNDSDLVLTVSDNGKGMNLRELDILNNHIHSHTTGIEVKNKQNNNTGIALENSNKRIQLWFGEKYGINVYSTEGFGTDVEIIVPVTKEGDKILNESNHPEYQ